MIIIYIKWVVFDYISPVYFGDCLKFDLWHRQGIFPFSKMSRLVLGHSHPPGAFSPEVKQPWTWSWPLTQFYVEVTNVCSYTRPQSLCVSSWYAKGQLYFDICSSIYKFWILYTWRNTYSYPCFWFLSCFPWHAGMQISCHYYARSILVL